MKVHKNKQTKNGDYTAIIASEGAVQLSTIQDYTTRHEQIVILYTEHYILWTEPSMRRVSSLQMGLVVDKESSM